MHILQSQILRFFNFQKAWDSGFWNLYSGIWILKSEIWILKKKKKSQILRFRKKWYFFEKVFPISATVYDLRNFEIRISFVEIMKKHRKNQIYLRNSIKKQKNSGFAGIFLFFYKSKWAKSYLVYATCWCTYRLLFLWRVFQIRVCFGFVWFAPVEQKLWSSSGRSA